ncbi:unnamed protein product [Euphydryas editha]|uniref:C2H2-type domain-containing protein n=1 Tax=Euphydryas editha TaxID=104508 RepID=A0AAU9T985_EUPED|nr:unnamed protein product [Euphydryas editha]
MESKKDVYVISLDAVDLNLLPISQKPYDGRVVPLWSKSNLDLRNNEYYEFEIKTNDTREEKNDQVIENVICHICDINVPKVYFNEHKNSFRHKFNAKIADIALRRLQLFMNKDDVNESYEKNPSKYYCSECSLVIDSDDEISHKQSIVHRNSIFLERFLNDFLNFYTNDENEINYSKKENKIAKSDLYSGESNISKTAIINDSKEDREKIEVAKIMKHCRDSEKDFDSDEPNNSETVTINDSKEDREKIEVAKITKHCRDSEDFDSDEPNILETVIISDSKTDAKNSTRDLDLDEENKKLDSSSIFHKHLQVKDGVVFETDDGSRFKVTELNFNAIKKISTLLEYCIICQRIFVIEKRSLHLNSDHHSENMLQKLPDKNCIRKVRINLYPKLDYTRGFVYVVYCVCTISLLLFME